MALLDEITEDIGDAFDTDLSDAVSSFTASKYSRNQSDFDPSSGSVTRTSETFTIRGVLIMDTEIEASQLGGQPDELKLLCLTQELLAAGSALDIGDTLANSDGKVYTIYKRIFDPVLATTTFHLKGET